MSKKSIDQTEISPNYKNKYFQVLLLGYYSYSRNLFIDAAYKEINEKDLWKNLYEEYIQYLAGNDIYTAPIEDDDSSFKKQILSSEEIQKSDLFVNRENLFTNFEEA